MPMLVQDVVVALVALMAALVLIRRLVGVVRPAAGAAAGCDACARGTSPCATPGRQADTALPAHPVTVIRSASR